MSQAQPFSAFETTPLCSDDDAVSRTRDTAVEARSSRVLQEARYSGFYTGRGSLRRWFRFDVRYRCRRLHEVFAALDLDTRGARVLDYGFGGGDLLATFESDCELDGVEISASAVDAARADPRFSRFRSAHFTCVPGDRPEDLPAGPFDVVLSSHTLEHVPDDRRALVELRKRLAPGGIAAFFVPIEEPDYIGFHVRNYSLQSFAERVEQAGFEPLLVEGSMYVNGHLWKLVTIPSRREWPVVGPIVDAVRLCTLSSIPYPLLRSADAFLYRLGFGARQALVVARAARASK